MEKKEFDVINGEIIIEEKMRGIKLSVDGWGRMKNLPSGYRRELGINESGAELEAFLLKNGIFLRPVLANEDDSEQ